MVEARRGCEQRVRRVLFVLDRNGSGRVEKGGIELEADGVDWQPPLRVTRAPLHAASRCCGRTPINGGNTRASHNNPSHRFSWEAASSTSSWERVMFLSPIRFTTEKCVGRALVQLTEIEGVSCWPNASENARAMSGCATNSRNSWDRRERE